MSQNINNMAVTWNAGATTFDAIKIDVTDTASAADSLLIDLGIGGVSQFNVGKSGDLFVGGDIVVNGDSLQLNADSTGTSFISNGSGHTSAIGLGHNTVGNAPLGVFFTALRINGSKLIEWCTGAINGAADLILSRDSAGVLAQRNGANPQEYQLSNTYTDASNYERGGLRWTGNTLEVFSEAAGTGTPRDLVLNGANRAAKINDPAGGATVDAEARTAINALIDAMEAHGISTA